MSERSAGQPLILLPPTHIGDSTHVGLRNLMGKDHHSLLEIATLLEEFAAAWHPRSAFEGLANAAGSNFHLFSRGQVQVWSGLFVNALREDPLFSAPAPPNILELFQFPHPRCITDRSWLVMFYSIALNKAGTDPSNASVRAQLANNLWLSFDDAEFLLEPALETIRELIIMACNLEDFLPPKACSIIINKACAMLQTLGITNWPVQGLTEEDRVAIFWKLNFIDNAIGLILSKQATFHREIAMHFPLPTVGQLMNNMAHPGLGRSSLFYGHYIHQMYRLSRVMAEVSYSLHAPSRDRTASTAMRDVEDWYMQAKTVTTHTISCAGADLVKILNAAALAEEPLLSSAQTGIVASNMRLLELQYLYLRVMLASSSRETMVTQAVEPSLTMLRLLPSLHEMTAADNQPLFALALWQWLQFPLPAFGILWGRIFTGLQTLYNSREDLLGALECVPPFFECFSTRSLIAGKLQSVTARLVQHARSIADTDDSIVEPKSDPRASPDKTIGGDSSFASDRPDFFRTQLAGELPDVMFALGSEDIPNNTCDWIAFSHAE